MTLPPLTRCPKCGYRDYSVVCKFCSVWKGVSAGDAAVFVACLIALPWVVG